MQGISRALGSAISIHFQGSDYLIDGLKASDWGTVEHHLLSKRPNPLELAQDAAVTTIEKMEQRIINDEMTPEQARVLRDRTNQILDKAYDRAIDEARKTNFITPQEMTGYTQTVEGIAFCFWIAFEKSYKGRFKVKDMYDIFAAMSEQKRQFYADQLAKASGIDDLGNSTGLTSETSTDQAASSTPAPGIDSSGTPTNLEKTTSN